MSSMRDWLTNQARVTAARDQLRNTHCHSPKVRVDLASNDYLGLAKDPRVAAAARDAIGRYGTGARASRVVTGTLPPHQELEELLCELTGSPAALVFSSGYAANLAAVTALARPGSVIFADEHVHASLKDGAALSGRPTILFRHGDLYQLEQLLSRRQQPRAIVLIESVYSALGDLAPIARIIELVRRYDAFLIVDEAHATGTLGDGTSSTLANRHSSSTLAYRHGRIATGLSGTGLGNAGLSGPGNPGNAELTDHVAVTMTLSKALGSQGGAVLGSPALREHLVNIARTFLFDTGLAPASAAAAARAVRIVRDEPGRVAALRENVARLASGLGQESPDAPFLTLPVRDAGTAKKMALTLREEGVGVACFRPPSVPDGVSRLRISGNASHTATELDFAIRLIVMTLQKELTLRQEPRKPHET